MKVIRCTEAQWTSMMGVKIMTNDNGLPKVQGVGRIADNDRALLVMLDRRPTDDELRAFHGLMRHWRFQISLGSKWVTANEVRGEHAGD